MAEPTMKFMRSEEIPDNAEEGLNLMAKDCVESMLRDLKRIERYNNTSRLPLMVGAVPIVLTDEPHHVVFSAFIVARRPNIEAFIENFRSALTTMLEESESNRRETEHMVATTCAGCGAKGEQPGPEGMVHKTIICPKCTSRE